jgi:uncharacterized protein YodC (DUF2158 family)
MKTTYTNEQLQEAIDEAFHESSGDDGFWLGIARAFLDNLPEQTEQGVLSLSQLRPLSEAGEVPEGCVRVTGAMEEKWHLGSEPFRQDTHFADIRLPATEEAEARGKLWEYYSRKYGVMDWGYVNRQEPDPYAELKKAHAEGKTIQFKPHGCPWEDSEKPDFTAPIACYRIKPEPETFESHGKTWTPQVGDVVSLKSGGPLMTVDFIEFDPENKETLVNCLWIKPNGDPSGLKIPTHMLQSATKEDAQ